MSAGTRLAASTPSYTELGLDYHGVEGAPEAVAPWPGLVTSVRGLRTLLHVPTRSQVVLMDENGGEVRRIDVQPGEVLLPARSGAVAWLVGQAGEQVRELAGDGRLRPLELRAPEVAIRSGLVIDDGVALLVTHEGGLVRFDAEGARPVPLPPRTPRIWSISPGPGAGYLATHRKGCAVTALTATFDARWRFGGVAGNGPGQLSGPEHAVVWQGEVVVADSRNNRLVRLNLQGHPAGVVAGGSVGSEDGLLSYPSSMCTTSAGRLLVSDAGNSRVLAYDEDRSSRRTVWGRPVVRSSRFHYPRSAEPSGGRRLLVADAYHHRVVCLGADGEEVDSWDHAEGEAFSWPRHAVEVNGSLTVVDSRNSRVLSAVDGRLRAHDLRGAGGEPFVHSDPHFLRPLPSGFLLSDSYANRVAQFDLAGRLVASWGGEPHHSATHTFVPGQLDIGVKDCHDGLMSEDGRTVWVVDTGQHRVIRFAPDGSDQRPFEVRGDLLDDKPLSYPRSISVLDRHVAIADAGNHRVLVCEIDTGTTAWSFGGDARGLSTRTLDDPRFVRLRRGKHSTHLTVVDYGNHRILQWALQLPGVPR